MRVGFPAESPEDEEILVVLVPRILGLEPASITVIPVRQRARGRAGVIEYLDVYIDELLDQGADLIVAVVDNDRKKLGRWLQALQDKVNRSAAPNRCASGIAVQAMEAWLLTDEDAVARSISASKKIPQGKLNTEDYRFPKRDFERLVRKYSSSRDIPKGCRSRVAEQLCLRLAMRRNSSFEHFARDVQRVASDVQRGP